jgi:hypothetical protein
LLTVKYAVTECSPGGIGLISWLLGNLELSSIDDMSTILHDIYGI